MQMEADPRGWDFVDFETFPTKPRPHYPPRTVGVAIKLAGGKTKYYAYNHPNGGNNCTRAEAKAALREVWRRGRPVGFHNAKFDCDAAHLEMGLPRLPAERVHDTMLALFIYNPRAKTYRLKPACETLLGMPPDERDRVVEWLVKNQPVEGVRLTATEPKSKKSKKDQAKASTAYAGAYIAYAPGDLVGKYACGDVDRTAKLARFLIKKLRGCDGLKAYDVERLLLEPIAHMEQTGVPVDVKRLRRDVALCKASVAKVDAWLERRTKAPKGTNWNSSPVLVKYLVDAGLADREKLGFTPKGKRRKGADGSIIFEQVVASNKEALERGITDPHTLSILKYRSRMLASLRTFMEPWLAVASLPESKGRIFTDWRTTVTDEGGARTGRLASSPNFQNLLKRKVYLFGKDKLGKPKPAPAWWRKLGLADLPWVRGYILPFPGCIIVDRDYSQQELRVLAHYTGGDLLEAYLADNWLDVHAHVQERVRDILGEALERESIKTTVFLIVYGGGLGKLAMKLGCTVERAKQIRDAVMAAVPGLKELKRRLSDRCDEKLPIRTYGGRLYFVEPPVLKHGKIQTFDYKMLNLLIQGSSADCTKLAFLALWKAIKHRKGWNILLTVHDEFVLSVPRKDVAEAHRVLARAMASVQFKVPMLSEGKTGPTWGSLEPYDKKGEVIALWRPKAKRYAEPLRKAA